jgi:hypothetical protein
MKLISDLWSASVQYFWATCHVHFFERNNPLKSLLKMKSFDLFLGNVSCRIFIINLWFWKLMKT